jgi:hypothetical protein
VSPESLSRAAAEQIADLQRGGVLIILSLNPDGTAASFIGYQGTASLLPALSIAGAAHLELSSLIEESCALANERDENGESDEDDADDVLLAEPAEEGEQSN